MEKNRQSDQADNPNGQPPPYSPPAHLQHSTVNGDGIAPTGGQDNPGYGNIHPQTLGQPIIIQQPGPQVRIITEAPLFGPNPATVYCGACEQTVRTKIVDEIITPTHICAAFLCLMLLWPFVACIYCTRCGKTSNHYCSNCNAYQGTYDRPHMC